jgi:hypothetical protein
MLAGLGCGLLFGLGLIVSGMANPAKVLAFLDVGAIGTGGWDPSLAFVMGGAVAVSALGVRLAARRRAPLLAPRFDWPEATRADAALVAGAAVFGLGWGLGGFCPGPALASLALGAPDTLAFLATMTAGLFLGRALKARMARP